jgi:hypothetical protein
VDTTKYNRYKDDLSAGFDKVMSKTFYLAPSRVELYRYKKKN